MLINNSNLSLKFKFSMFKQNIKFNVLPLNLYVNKYKVVLNYLKYNFKSNKIVNLINNYKKIYHIKFNVNNISKYFNINNSLPSINFLRKNKVFNKGRYSRNRQYYRTGVYWCLYINIIAVIGMYFWFYRINMNFTYLWWIFYFSIVSIFLPKIININIISYVNLNKTFYSLFIWLYYILIDFFKYIFRFKFFF